MIPKI